MLSTFHLPVLNNYGMTWIVLALLALWLLWPQYKKWQHRQKLRDFEQQQRRKWEQHRRE